MGRSGVDVAGFVGITPSENEAGSFRLRKLSIGGSFTPDFGGFQAPGGGENSAIKGVEIDADALFFAIRGGEGICPESRGKKEMA